MIVMSSDFISKSSEFNNGIKVCEKAIKILRQQQAGTLNWIALKYDMISPDFDMEDALSQLNKVEKKQMLAEMKFTYENQLKTLKQGKIVQTEYES